MVCNKKENQFSLNGNGIMLSFLGQQCYHSTLCVCVYIYIYIYTYIYKCRIHHHPPTNNIAQSPKLAQVKTAQVLSRLLPHNQPSLKELIPSQRGRRRRRCRIRIIFTSLEVPTSIQLADKNKTGCNSIQTLIFLEHPTHAWVWQKTFFIVGNHTHLAVPKMPWALLVFP